MLILSRRINEKISLPDLGIEIKVAAIKPTSTKLGIRAPQSIRIMRSELCDQPFMFQQKEECYGQDEISSPPESEVEYIQSQMDTANLALYLAQNQLQAERTEYAEESLATAIEALQKLNDLFREHPDWKDHLPVSQHVRESASKYHVGKRLAWMITDPASEETTQQLDSLNNDAFLQDYQVEAKSLPQAVRERDTQKPDMLMMPVATNDPFDPPMLPTKAGRLQWQGYSVFSKHSFAVWTDR